MQNKSIKRIVSIILCMALISGIAVCIPALSAVAEQTASNGMTRSENQAKANQIAAELAELQAQKADKEKIKAVLDEQVANTEEKISIVTDELNKINAELSVVQAELDKRQAELDKNKTVFKQRLRAMYMSSGSSELQVLLGSDDVADYLAKAELTRSVSEHDEVLIDEIVTALSEIESKAAVIKEKKTQQDSVKKELAETQATLNTQVNELAAAISDDQSTIDEKSADLESYQAAVSEIDAMFSSIGEGSNGVIYSGGQFNWPCPGYYYISSGFKWRWGKQHKGIDIAGSGISGKPIVAAASGVVSTASFNAGGYGNYVIVNHGTSSDGNSYATLYGHMTRYCVSAGQSVSAGQTIGYVGSTGASTGPHLHFEIRINGTAVDPTQFFN